MKRKIPSEEDDNAFEEPSSCTKRRRITEDKKHSSVEVVEKQRDETTDDPRSYSLTEVTGDLFSSSDSLCHCVSQDLKMDKGIAKIFKTRFGRMNELKLQGVQTGGVAVLKVDDRFIYNLVSKAKYYQKPTYADLESSLKAMKEHIVANKVTRVSMPLIGCGLDRLSWDRVKTMLSSIFGQLNIEIVVYKLPPTANTISSSRGNRFSKK